MGSRRRWTVAILVTTGLCALWLVAPLESWLSQLSSMSERAPITTLLCFSLAYIVGAFALAPATPMAIAGGWLWGAGWGFVVVFCVGMVADVLPFLLVRRLRGRGLAPSRERGRLASILESAATESGFLLVLLVRWFPLAPFNLMNYALATTSVSLRDYTVATALACVPTTFLCVYAGAVLPGAGASVARSWVFDVPILVLGGVSVVVLAMLSRRHLQKITL